MTARKTSKVEMELNVTEREKELVSLLTEGKTAPKTAAKAGTNESSLAAELSKIRAKYDCDNSIQLVAFFLRNKLID